VEAAGVDGATARALRVLPPRAAATCADSRRAAAGAA